MIYDNDIRNNSISRDEFDKINNKTKLDSPYDMLEECLEPECKFNRNNNEIRNYYLKSIVDFSVNKKNLKILFIGCHMLLQELKILLVLGNSVDEVHLFDHSYGSINYKDKYEKMFNQFYLFLKRAGLNVQIKIHTNHNIVNNIDQKNCFDIIAGIDFDGLVYVDNRDFMKKISVDLLKPCGRLFISQQFNDIVDISEYEIGHDDELHVVRINDFINSKFYFKYYLGHIYLPLTITSFCLSVMFITKPLGMFLLGLSAGFSYGLFILGLPKCWNRHIHKISK